MGRQDAPTTIVILCHLPRGTTAAETAGLRHSANRAGVPVSWVAETAEFEGICGQIAGSAGTSDEAVLALDEASLGSRPSLRQALTTARRTRPDLTAVVGAADLTMDHRSLLVAEGVATACLRRFDDLGRGSRRPAPQGWHCRSMLWGLWEVTVSPWPATGRMLPWAASPIGPRGSLRVIEIGRGVDRGNHSPRSRLDQLLALVQQRCVRGQLQAARLSDLPDLLSGGGRSRTGSVLTAA